MRVARSGLRVWASRNCLLEEGGVSEACGLMRTGGQARAHSPSQGSLSYFLEARERTLGTRLVAGAMA